ATAPTGTTRPSSPSTSSESATRRADRPTSTHRHLDLVRLLHREPGKTRPCASVGGRCHASKRSRVSSQQSAKEVIRSNSARALRTLRAGGSEASDLAEGGPLMAERLPIRPSPKVVE